MSVIQMGDQNIEEVKDSIDEMDGEETTDVSSASETPSGEQSDDDQGSSDDITVDDSVDENGIAEAQARLDAIKAEEERVLQNLIELRKDRRDIKQNKHNPLITENNTDLDDVNPQDIALIEKVIQAKGYVRKEELTALSYSEKLDNYKEEWLQVHPEYLPENDPDDKNWNLLTSTLNNYFKSPEKPSDIKKILDVVHGMIKPSPSLPIKNRASVDASKEKIISSSRGSSTGVGHQTAPSSKSNVNREAFKGFSKEELDELGI